MTAVLLTIGLIARSLGSRACSSLKPLLDSMIARGLSSAMTATCSLIAEHIPELKRDVQVSGFAGYATDVTSAPC